MNGKNLILGKILLLDLNLNKSYNTIGQFIMPLRPSVNQAYIIEGQQELEHSIHKIYCFKVNVIFCQYYGLVIVALPIMYCLVYEGL